MVDVKAERILLDRKEMDIKADYLSSLVPPGTARYHFYRFKHTHEGDYQEAVGKGSPLPSLFLSSFPLLLCSSPPLSPLLSPSSFHPLPSPSPLPPLSLPPPSPLPPSLSLHPSFLPAHCHPNLTTIQCSSTHLLASRVVSRSACSTHHARSLSFLLLKTNLDCLSPKR